MKPILFMLAIFLIVAVVNAPKSAESYVRCRQDGGAADVCFAGSIPRLFEDEK